MAFQVKSYGPEHEPLVKAFNARMAAGGTHWRFYETCAPDWLAPGLSKRARRDYYVALDDGDAVRAGFCLKPQQFLLNGEPLTMAGIQGPVSEGLVDPRYGLLAILLIRDMEEREGGLFCWGPSERMRLALEQFGWPQFSTPFLMRIRRVGRFLRGAGILRKRAKARAALDILAFTGLGALGIRLAQLGQAAIAGGLGIRAPSVETCERFGDWADEIWERAKSACSLVAVRDKEALNALLPAQGWPETTILRMSQDGGTIGWAAVRDTQFTDDSRFGDLRVGSVVDFLALPGREAAVVKAASAYLDRRGVDLIFTTYTHPAWIAAFRKAGFLVTKGLRPFVINSVLEDRFGDLPAVAARMHMTPIDGDGPRGL